METLQDTGDRSFSLRHTDYRTQKYSRNNPEEEQRIRNTMHFKIDEDDRVESVGICCCHRPGDCDSDQANEKAQCNPDGKVFGCPIGCESVRDLENQALQSLLVCVLNISK